MSGRLRAHLTVMVCGSQYAGVTIPASALILLNFYRKASLGLHSGLHSYRNFKRFDRTLHERQPAICGMQILRMQFLAVRFPLSETSSRF
jgi:hypothetical protein